MKLQIKREMYQHHFHQSHSQRRLCEICYLHNVHVWSLVRERYYFLQIRSGQHANEAPKSDMLQIEVQRHVSHAKKNMEEARGINIFRIIHGKKPE